MTNKRYAHLLVRVGLVVSAVLAISFGIWEICGDVPSALKPFEHGREFSFSRWWDVLAIFAAIQAFGWVIRFSLEDDVGSSMHGSLFFSVVSGALFASGAALAAGNFLSESVFWWGLIGSFVVPALLGTLGIISSGGEFNGNEAGLWCGGSWIGTALITYLILGLHIGYLLALLFAPVIGFLSFVAMLIVFACIKGLCWLFSRKSVNWLLARNVK